MKKPALTIALLVFVACNKSVKISNNTRLTQTDTGYVLLIDKKVVNDTVFNVKLIGKDDLWLYVYGDYGRLRKPGWMQIIDYNDEVDSHMYWGNDELALYERNNIKMYLPDDAIKKHNWTDPYKGTNPFDHEN